MGDMRSCTPSLRALDWEGHLPHAWPKPSCGDGRQPLWWAKQRCCELRSWKVHLLAEKSVPREGGQHAQVSEDTDHTTQGCPEGAVPGAAGLSAARSVPCTARPNPPLVSAHLPCIFSANVLRFVMYVMVLRGFVLQEKKKPETPHGLTRCPLHLLASDQLQLRLPLKFSTKTSWPSSDLSSPPKDLQQCQTTPGVLVTRPQLRTMRSMLKMTDSWGHCCGEAD